MMNKEKKYFSNIEMKYEGNSEEFVCKNLEDYTRSFNKDDLPVLNDKNFDMNWWYNKYIVGQICGVTDETGLGAYFIDPAIVYAIYEKRAKEIYAKFNCIDYSKCDIISTSEAFSSLAKGHYYSQYETSNRMIGYCPILMW